MMVHVIDVTGIRVDVEILVSADPQIVWDLLADITRVPEWSPECVHTAWLDEIPDVTGAVALPAVTVRATDSNGQ
jgi:hypothetical protein